MSLLRMKYPHVSKWGCMLGKGRFHATPLEDQSFVIVLLYSLGFLILSKACLYRA